MNVEETSVIIGSISDVFSNPVFDSPEKEERGLISRTAAGYRAQFTCK